MNQSYKTLNDLAKIIHIFNDFKVEEASVMEISRALKMSPSKVSRMVGTWEREDFFEKNPESGKYRLGVKFFELGIVYAFHFPLRKIIRPHIEQISKDCDISVSYAIFRNDKPIIVDRIQALNIDLFPYRLGFNLPLHTTSLGKILLAYLSEEEQERILQSQSLTRFTDATIVDVKLIKENLKLIKEKGYATDAGETHEDWNCISVPIIDGNGSLVAAITLMDEKTRNSAEQLFQCSEYLKEKALFVSRQLGYEMVL